MQRSFTVHDLPASERPRERLLAHGVQALSLVELLAIILGRGVAGSSVLVTAQELLSRFGSLSGLAEASLADLQSIKGLGIAKATQLQSCIEIARRLSQSEQIVANEKVAKVIVSAKSLAAYIRPKITHFSKEHFFLVSLDTRKKIIGLDTISVGTLNASLVHPREVFEAAIRHHAAAVIFAHNHPSGDFTPSTEDIRVTKTLVEAARVLEISVLDHIIVTTDSYLSMRTFGVMEY